MILKIPQAALELLQSQRPFGYRLYYHVIGPRNQLPDVDKIYRFFRASGSLLGFHHFRPGFEGNVTFESERDVLKLLKSKLHPLDETFTLETTNKAIDSPKPEIRYYPHVFPGFHPSAQLKTLSANLLAFPSLKKPPKPTRAFTDD